MKTSHRTGAPAIDRPDLSWSDMERVAHEAVVAPTTVRRWARGEKVSGLTLQRITKAMNHLGMGGAK
jgi:hypothetical protein